LRPHLFRSSVLLSILLLLLLISPLTVTAAEENQPGVASPPAAAAPRENRLSLGAAYSVVVPSEKALFGDAVRVDKATMPEVNLTYLASKAWSLELAYGRYTTTLKNTTRGADMGDLTVSPIRLTLQYRYNDGGIASYYVGVGAGYFLTKFDTADSIRKAPSISDPTLEFKFKNAIGGQIDGGFDYFLARWLALNVDLKYWLAQSNAKFEGTTTGSGSDHYHLDSFAAGLGLKLFF
jgi:outer membrane protein W